MEAPVDSEALLQVRVPALPRELAEDEVGRRDHVDVRVDPLLEELLRGTVANLRGQAARKRLALRLSMPPDLPVVRGDAEQLLQFFTALFSAAIENTPENGRVSLDIERSHGSAIRLSIADSGNGLPLEEIQAAAGRFAPFGSLDLDGVTGPETRVMLRWPRERWRADPRALAVAPRFW